MNARVFLLLLVTGLFMAAWNGDQAAKQEFLVLRAQQRAATAVTRARSESRHSTLPGSSVVARLTEPMHTSLITDRHVVSNFQPDGMGAGTYRAVSETGVTFEVTIGNDAGVTARDFYVADSPTGTRWYFVRIEPTN